MLHSAGFQPAPKHRSPLSSRPHHRSAQPKNKPLLLSLQVLLDKVVEGRVDLLHVPMRRDQQLFMRVLQHTVDHIDVNSTMVV